MVSGEKKKDTKVHWRQLENMFKRSHDNTMARKGSDDVVSLSGTIGRYATGIKRSSKSTS